MEALNQLLDDLEDRGALTDPVEVLLAFQEWAESTGRPLYPHQQEAAERLILEDKHLIAPTPTGSGKSLIGVAAILWSLARGGVSYYTAPLKALVGEKFFDLVDLFGAANVGMVTGDGSVNADAPIICATAEILANQALRWGDDLNVDTVVMDEFHYYADPERGWAWQAPLLTLTKTRFVLMSATLGDTSWFAKNLWEVTGREVAVLDSAKRPVPLEMSYAAEPLEKILQGLANQDRLPAYVVHPSQRAAVEEAERIASLDLRLGLDPDTAARLKDQVNTVQFHSSFGKTLKPLLLKGIGIHHAGMLPRYRRLVEKLAQAGLLRVISGTDTLGVGINVPIRTVVMTSLVKFDGNKERHLNSREFHQVAGRAGRAGFDTVGYVVAQAPEWEIDNAIAIARADGNAKQLEKIKKKKAPEGRTSWTEGTFNRLAQSAPEAMVPRWKITHAMVLNTLQKPGDQAENLNTLVYRNHNVLRATGSAKDRNPFADTLQHILESLEDSGVISGGQLTRADSGESGSGSAGDKGRPQGGHWTLTADLPETFALNQDLAPFALDYLQAFTDHADSPSADTSAAGGAFGDTLDVISVVESVLDDPNAILRAQERAAKDRVFAELKASGADYDERQTALERTTYPKPLSQELEAAFDTYVKANPWARGYFISPKSIIREMVETGQTFQAFEASLKIEFSEGVLLRYLSDAWRALTQIVPEPLKTERFIEVLDWLNDTIDRVDSSLLDEWKFLENPELRKTANLDGTTSAGGPDETELAFGERPDGTFDYRLNPAKLGTELHRELFSWLDMLGGDEFERLSAMETKLRSDQGGVSRPLAEIPPITESGWDKQLGAYWDAHDFMETVGEARHRRNFRVITQPTEADLPASIGISPEAILENLWLAELTIVDGDGDLDFGFYALLDPEASNEAFHPIWAPLGLWERL